jgi:hypothetical protein
MSIVYLAIDPGRHGGLAALGPSSRNTTPEIVHLERMPATDEGLITWVRSHKAAGPGGITFGALEKGGGWVPRGPNAAKRQPGSAMFEFGASFGVCRMALVAAGITPVWLVPPNTWQRGLGFEPRSPGESQPSHKRRLRDFARTLFPVLGARVTLSTCDALLIAEFCRRTKEGTLGKRH